MELKTISGELIATNDDWRDGRSEQHIINLGFDVGMRDADAAVIVTLDDGAYTPIVRGVGGGTGVGIIEIFDLDNLYITRLTNVSTRGFVGTGSDVLIGGFIVEDGPKDVLVRARGPAAVPGFLANPWVELKKINGDLIESCDDWRLCGDEQEIINAGYNIGLSDSDAAMIVTLGNGLYTPIVRGVGGTTGVGIVEAIELD
jgi:hypothetical protein